MDRLRQILGVAIVRGVPANRRASLQEGTAWKPCIEVEVDPGKDFRLSPKFFATSPGFW